MNMNEIFGKVGGSFDNEAVSIFMDLLNLPDEKFNAMAPQLTEGLTNSFTSTEVRKTMLEQMKKSPAIDLEKEAESIDDVIEEINSNKDLSQTKKDILVMLMKNTLNLIAEILDNPRELVKVKIKKMSEDAIIPEYAHKSDAGADVCALEETKIPPQSTVIVRTGLKVDIPNGYEIQIRPRSGMSAKTNLIIANAPGTIDAQYHGEIGIILKNVGNLTATIEKGQKIAQMVVAPVPMIQWEITEEDFADSERGEGGFGSTDKK